MTVATAPNQTKSWFDQYAESYKAARPDYPEALFEYLAGQTPGHDLALDCGAGNGQATVRLAQYYAHVEGLDIGENQLKHAAQAPNVAYRVSDANTLSFGDGSVDLVTAATAAHWFEHEKFYPEVDRVLKPGGALAVWAYYLPKVEPAIDSLVKEFFEVTLDPNVDQRRQLLVNGYRDLPFPYKRQEKTFDYSIGTDFNRFAAVLETSSLIKREVEKTGVNPLDAVKGQLLDLWGGDKVQRTVTWQNSMVIGHKPGPG